MPILSLKKPFKIFLKVQGSLALGAVLSLGLLQEDPWLQARFEHFIKQSIESVIGVPFSCKLSKVDLLGGVMVATQMYAASPEGAWSFSCPHTGIRFSWFSYLKGSGFETHLVFHKATIYSRYENKQWAIVDPFIKLVKAPTTVPIKFMSCAFQQGTANLTRDDFQLTMLASSMSDILEDMVATRIFVAEGNFERNKASWAKRLTGTINIDVPIENVDNYAVKMQVTADLPFVPAGPQKSLLLYTYKNSKGSWQWYPEDRSFMIMADGLTFNPNDTISMDAHIAGSLEKVALYLPREQGAMDQRSFDQGSLMNVLKNIQGTVTGQAHVDIGDDTIEYKGTGRVQDLCYGSVKLGPAAVAIKGNKQRVSGTIDLESMFGGLLNGEPGLATSGSWHCDLVTGKCDSTWGLSQKYTSLPKIIIEKEGTQTVLTYKNGMLSGTYTITVTLDGAVSGGKSKKVLVKGKIESDSSQLKLSGTIDGVPFSLRMQLDPYEITHFSYARADKTEIPNETPNNKRARTRGQRPSGQRPDGQRPNDQRSGSSKGITLEKKDGALEGSIDFEYIKDALVHFFGFHPQGKGRIAIKAHMNSTPLSVDVSMYDGNIKIPEAHNFIKEAEASLSFDTARRSLTVKNAKLQLQKGSLSSQCATLVFSDGGSLSYAHLPCIANNAFIGWNKDFFGMLSGGVTGIYNTGKKGGHWTCTGALTLDKAHLRSNLLSSQVQKDLLKNSSALGKNVELDLQVSTKSPLMVKTFFFNTNAQINASVKGTVAQPQVAGLIELNKGSFFFPYKPLYVSMGKLSLTPDQPDDPVIELIAKNTVKKYVVTMRVSGLVHQPKISFESSPPLPEEQIITLLLSGSEDGPLYAAMPTMVMMHLESLLFGSNEHSSKAQQFFKTLLKPFKNVRFVPTLSGEEGKTIQGTIEVDFTDRLRAKAKNNLKLSEETKFEVEYSLSDDMTVKAIRDDTGSLGGEVEMRWKF